MDLKSYSKTLTEIYMVANTPLYLYETMRSSAIVSDYIAKHDTKELIKEFNIRTATSISEISEIAEIYSIMISLTFKRGHEVDTFFKYISEHIKFEWFSKIANYYLSGRAANHSTILNIQITPASKVEITNQPTYNVIS